MRGLGLLALIVLAVACGSESRTARPLTSPLGSESASPSGISTPAASPSASAPSRDALETAVRAFMDARMRRDAETAERYLSSNAKQQYDSNEGGLHLVSPTSDPHYTRYQIERRDGVDASSSEFVVRIHSGYTGSPDDAGFLETLGVGPGANASGSQMPAVIRFARR